MDGFPKISAEPLKVFLHAKVDELAEQLVEIANRAESGRLIADTEEPARVALAELTQAAYESLLQHKVNAAEAAFSPSAASHDRPETAKQRAAGAACVDDQRADQTGASLVARSPRRQRRSGRSTD
jgi:hypothetical protein